MNYRKKQKGFSLAIGVGILALVLIIGVYFYSAESGGDGRMSDNAKMESEKKELTMDGEEENPEAVTGDLPMDIDPAKLAEKQDNKITDIESEEPSEEAAQDIALPDRPNQYVDYTREEYAAKRDNKRLLFFHASWCPTCRVAESSITENSGDIPEGLTIFKVDYDREDDLKEKYGITYQHTFVQIDSEGRELAKWNGGGIEKIIANLE